MRYFIMCGGNYPAWKIPRQLMKVKGEMILYRTIRLLIENGIDADDILVTASDERFFDLALPVNVVKDIENNFVAGQSGWWLDAFMKYPAPACYIFGDVYFSERAISKIVNTHTTDIAFFASAPPYDFRYIKPWEEPFAFKVENQEHFREAIKKTKELYEMKAFNRHPIAWELWQVIRNTRLNIVAHNYCEIRDYTCDVDKKEDILKLEEVLND